MPPTATATAASPAGRSQAVQGAWAASVRRVGALDPRLAALGLLVAAFLVRLELFSAGFWIDDGISVGIASHPLTEIPSVLRQDGSPPLYYGLLHVWMRIFGSGEEATYALSLLFSLLAVPAAALAGRSLFGTRAGWACAVLAAFNPVAVAYSGQARMYTLVVLLSLVSTATFVQAFVHGRRGALVTFGISLALLLYTHGWAIFFAVGCAAAVVPCVLLTPGAAARRGLLRDAVVTFGLVGLAFAPWLPVLLEQAAQTGAPWSIAPARADLVRMCAFVLGVGLVSPLMLAAALGYARAREVGDRRALRTAAVLGVLLVVCVVVGWKAGRLTETWAPRYVAVAVGPALLLVGGGLAHAGRLGVVCVVFTVPLWLPGEPTTVSDKSNVAQALRRTETHPRPSDLVLVTQPELGPVVRYYLGDAPRYVSTLGPIADPQVMDWRNALDRLRATRAGVLEPLLDRVSEGGRVIVVRPKGRPSQVAWQRLIHLRTRQWLRVLEQDGRFRPVYETARGYRQARLNLVSVSVLERRRG